MQSLSDRRLAGRGPAVGRCALGAIAALGLVVMVFHVSAAFAAETVLASEEIDTRIGYLGARPFVGAELITAATVPAAHGRARLVLWEVSRKEEVSFLSSFDDSGKAVFTNTVNATGMFRFRRFDILSMAPKDKKGIKLVRLTAETHVEAARAISLEVDTGNHLHIAYPGEDRTVLVFRNRSGERIAGEALVTLRGFFGEKIEFAVGLELDGHGESRVALPAPIVRKGLWRVSAKVMVAGSQAVLESRFAVLDRNEATPMLEKPKFRMGFNFHCEWMADETFRMALDAAVAAGAKIVRIGNLQFSECERKRGEFDFSRADSRIDAIWQKGIAMDCIIYTAPAWARKPEYEKFRGNPRFHSVPTVDGAFREYCETVARRYGTRVDYYECGNEWDLVPAELLPVDEALRLQRECYEGVKAAGADACVIPNGWTVPDSNSWLGRKASNPGLPEAFAERGQRYFDVHPLHLHCGFELYEDYLQKRMFPFRRRYNVDKPWYANESAQTAVRGTEDAVAETVWKKILYAWAWGSTDYIWYNLVCKGWDPENDSEQGYGVITADFHPRATFAAFSALSAALQGLDIDKRLADIGARHVYRFCGTKAGFTGVAIAGWDSAVPVDGFAIDVTTDAKAAFACDLMGNRERLALNGGHVSWALRHQPSALLLEGATTAEPDVAALQDARENSVDSIAIPADSPDRSPDFVADGFMQVFENYAADPQQTHRTWGGPSDLSAKLWLVSVPDGMAVRIKVVDDVHVVEGDVAEITVGTSPSNSTTRIFHASARNGETTEYECLMPGQFAERFRCSARIRDDDGLGDDGYIEIKPVYVKFD